MVMHLRARFIVVLLILLIDNVAEFDHFFIRLAQRCVNLLTLLRIERRVRGWVRTLHYLYLLELPHYY
jgi:hypothetical protein